MAKNERKSRQFDVVIVGGGLVGAALAAALGGGALDIALIESRPPEPAGAAALIPGENWDSRVYAINPESVRFRDWCVGRDRARAAYCGPPNGDFRR
jgi:2-polyprenylphenol 6-hydroxylase